MPSQGPVGIECMNFGRIALLLAIILLSDKNSASEFLRELRCRKEELGK